MASVTRVLTAIVVSFCVVAALSASVQGAERFTKIGVSASVQGGQTNLMFPYWVSRWVVMAPSVSIMNVSDVGTDMGLGLFVRKNVRQGKAVPYFGARGGVLIFSPEGNDSVTDYVVGVAFGGEYLFDDHFSIGVEAQLNVTMSDEQSLRFNNPDGTNVNTATTVSATFYF